MGHLRHVGGNAAPVVVSLDVSLLVADRPAEDARVIAVAPDHALELAPGLGLRAEEARLVEHQHAQPIAGVEQLGRRRVVRRAIGVAAHLLEPLDAEGLQRVGKRRAHAGVVLMVARALQLDVPVVQEEPVVGVEAQRANAEGRLAAVDLGAVDLDARDQRVEVRRLERPERRAAHGELLANCGPIARRHARGAGAREARAIPRRVEHGSDDAHRGVGIAIVAHLRGNGERRRVAIDARRHERPPLRRRAPGPSSPARRGGRCRRPRRTSPRLGGVDAHDEDVLARRSWRSR